MKKCFSCIGIVGYPRRSSAFITHEILYHWLISQGYFVIVDIQIAKSLTLINPNFATLSQIGKVCDLVIVVGGDGNMLRALRILSKYNVKIIGINRGNLGFLTDLNPDTALQQLAKVLLGEYTSEKRFLLEIKISGKKNNMSNILNAINEVVLHAEHIAHMIEFEVYIDKKFAFSQRSDGLIISTPTGSTGYSLSAGGPILASSLNAIALVPMLPHTLSARPIVINNSSIICIKFSNININTKLKISCDSQVILSVGKKHVIFIYRSLKYIYLIHPKDYCYFNILNSKLNWSKKNF